MSSRRKFLRQLSVVSTCALPGTRFLGSVLGPIAGSPDYLRALESAARIGGAPGTWTPKVAPLMTEWASKVDPSAPLPEYPRPQMVRPDWLNLNGLWEFRKGGGKAPFGETLEDQILVPFAMESALSGIMEHADKCWYRRMITVPAGWSGKQVLLHFGAVDWESEVFVNGQSLGVHKGGYDPFTYNITPMLKGDGPQELVVRVFDPTEDGGQPRGKQVTKPRGIMYTPTTGIWQAVWMEPVAPSYIDSFRVTPDVDHAQVHLTVNTPQGSTADKVTVKVMDGKKTMQTISSTPNQPFVIPIAKAKLWSVDDPFLYDMEITLEQGGKKVDAITSYFGMRKPSIGELNGQKKIFFNDKPTFMKGPLDQGFWPDGIYTAPTDEALKSDIVRMKAMGFNYVRKHIKVEPARWYYWADKLGLMVWQDMPSCNSYEAKGFAAPPVDKAAYERELRAMIQTHWNVPSIFLWCCFNESQGQFESERIVGIVRELDPSRLVNEASGSTVHDGVGDLNDLHSYPEPNVRPYDGKQAMFCGEFGGIGHAVPGHDWIKEGKNFSYTDAQTAEDLLDLYAQFMAQIKDLRDNHNLSGYVYTELTDVEDEINGLMTYDRIPKLAYDRIKTVNDFLYKPATYTMVAPTSERAPQTWSYTFDNTDANWATPTFSDSKWKSGPGPFGTDHAGTKWDTPEIFMRRHFNPGALTPTDISALGVRLGVGNWDKSLARDAVVEIFINGVLAYSQKRQTSGYEFRAARPDARAALIANGDNVLAVHVKKGGHTGDPQFVDAGLGIRHNQS